MLALFYGGVIVGVLLTATYLVFKYFRDKYLLINKAYKRRHLKLIKGGKHETLFKKR